MNRLSKDRLIIRVSEMGRKVLMVDVSFLGIGKIVERFHEAGVTPRRQQMRNRLTTCDSIDEGESARRMRTWIPSRPPATWVGYLDQNLSSALAVKSVSRTISDSNVHPRNGDRSGGTSAGFVCWNTVV
jgi:hypothetical protein